jgi:hypothetical protein
VLRHSYCTYQFPLAVTYDEKKQMAYGMRTSVEELERTYNAATSSEKGKHAVDKAMLAFQLLTGGGDGDEADGGVFKSNASEHAATTPDNGDELDDDDSDGSEIDF